MTFSFLASLHNLSTFMNRVHLCDLCNVCKLSNYCFCFLGYETVKLLLNIRWTLIQYICIKQVFYDILAF